jgi:hypothetical protein
LELGKEVKHFQQQHVELSEEVGFDEAEETDVVELLSQKGKLSHEDLW